MTQGCIGPQNSQFWGVKILRLLSYCPRCRPCANWSQINWLLYIRKLPIIFVTIHTTLILEHTFLHVFFECTLEKLTLNPRWFFGSMLIFRCKILTSCVLAFPIVVFFSTVTKYARRIPHPPAFLLQFETNHSTNHKKLSLYSHSSRLWWFQPAFNICVAIISQSFPKFRGEDKTYFKTTQHLPIFELPTRRASRWKEISVQFCYGKNRNLINKNNKQFLKCEYSSNHMVILFGECQIAPCLVIYVHIKIYMFLFPSIVQGWLKSLISRKN